MQAVVVGGFLNVIGMIELRPYLARICSINLVLVCIKHAIMRTNARAKHLNIKLVKY